MNECGYLYVAAGDPKYLQEAEISATSLRAVDPTAHITLITDKQLDGSLFDRIVVRPVAFTSWRAGVAYRTKHIYQDSPYEKTLYLDTDTYIYEPCGALFGLLDHFDVCMAAAPADMNEPLIDGKPLTACFPYNAGVIAFKKNARNEFLFRTWHERHAKKLREGSLRHKEGDQPSFMEALVHSESRVYVLPSIWNARALTYVFLNGSVKVVHCREEDKEAYEKLRRKLNEITGIRCWDPRRKRCIYRKPNLYKRVVRQIRVRLRGQSNTLANPGKNGNRTKWSMD
jgi:hypothetical protein